MGYCDASLLSLIRSIMRTMRSRLFLLLTVALLAAACATPPEMPTRAASSSLTETGDTRLGKAIDPQVRRHPGLAGVLALAEGREAFALRVLLADAADRSIDIQTYIWHADATGLLVLDAVRRAAGRGVRVRLLIDDNSTAGMDALLAMLDAHPSIEIRLFNPFVQRDLRALGYLTEFSRLNRRMHNKSFTVDNQASIVGGRNIGDEYFAAGQQASFADLDVLVAGSVVREVSTVFDGYWNSASAYPADSVLRGRAPLTEAAFEADIARIRSAPDTAAYLGELARTPMARALLEGALPLQWVPGRVMADDPAKILERSPRAQGYLAPDLAVALGEPRTSVDLVSPYFVPGEAGAQALAALARRGIRVRVLTNSLAATDVAAVHAGYARRREVLLQAGVQLFELKPDTAARAPGPGGRLGSGSRASLHAKTFAVDRQRLFVGSYNLDPRSSGLNTEMGLVLESPALAGGLATVLDGIAPGSAYELTLDEQGRVVWLDGDKPPLRAEPGSSLLRRLAVRVLSWLPIEWML